LCIKEFCKVVLLSMQWNSQEEPNLSLLILLVVLKDYNLVWLIVLRKTIKLINTINNKDVIILLSII